MQNKNIQTTSHTIPEDMLIDTLRILFKGGMPFQIENINEQENTVLIQVQIDTKMSSQRSAIKNLQNLLAEYRQYRLGSIKNES